VEATVSASEYIFLRSGLDVEETAHTLADVLGFELEQKETGIFLGRDNAGQVEDYIAGQVSSNYLAESEPEIPDAIDHYPLMWEVYKKGIPDWIKQMEAGRAVFDEIVTKLRWPALLTHDSQIAIADFSPELGLRMFPADTSTDSPLVVSREPTGGLRTGGESPDGQQEAH
jgi:hypothetical protein